MARSTASGGGGNSKRSKTRSARLFAEYRAETGVFDEIFGQDGKPRPGAEAIVELFEALGPQGLRKRNALTELALRRGGITFSVYSDNRGVEKIFPFDPIPRPVLHKEWQPVEAGLAQRVQALNAFLVDVYGPQRILKEKVISRELVEGSQGFLKAMMGVKPSAGVYIPIGGIDLVRGPDGAFVVLEDNIRTPSGVSYVLENRAVMKRIYPRILEKMRVRPVSAYPLRLRDALFAISPRPPEQTRIVVLTPGPHNSAYFEHSTLARLMGCELAQGRDLFVHDDRVYMKMTRGPVPVDVIYRRIDDDFLDPKVFREDSLLGVPGLVDVYAKGGVALANAIGNGVADDKAIYPHVPAMIRFYLDEEPILGQVETYECSDAKQRAHVLGRLDQMVVKAVDASGGYGMLFGPIASAAEVASFADKIKAEPRRYIAQPVIELSTCPTWMDGRIAPRRVDLRPFVITGHSTWILPGGLTRVALAEGSYVVNSSQGGGAKETWVLEEGAL